MTENKTKIGEGALLMGIICIISALIFPFIAFFLFFIPIIFGFLALKKKDKQGYYGIILGVVSWLLSWFIMPYINSLLYQF